MTTNRRASVNAKRMSYKSIGVHACWLDKECRSERCIPAHTYVNLWWFTIRINPLWTRYGIVLDGPGRFHLGHRWSWHVLQVWRNHDRKPAPVSPRPSKPEQGSG